MALCVTEKPGGNGPRGCLTDHPVPAYTGGRQSNTRYCSRVCWQQQAFTQSSLRVTTPSLAAGWLVQHHALVLVQHFTVLLLPILLCLDNPTNKHLIVALWHHSSITEKNRFNSYLFLCYVTLQLTRQLHKYRNKKRNTIK